LTVSHVPKLHFIKGLSDLSHKARELPPRFLDSSSTLSTTTACGQRGLGESDELLCQLLWCVFLITACANLGTVLKRMHLDHNTRDNNLQLSILPAPILCFIMMTFAVAIESVLWVIVTMVCQSR
jgi:hypothetical protein